MKSKFKKIAIICASERELAPFLPLIENPTISERAMLRIHEGRLNGFEVAAGLLRQFAKLASPQPHKL